LNCIDVCPGRSGVEVILTFVIPVVAAMVLFAFGICTVMRKQAKSVIQLWKQTVTKLEFLDSNLSNCLIVSCCGRCC